MGERSEAVLKKLCQRSFLSLWSYANPYNDKGLAQRKEGKELCDLLVIFGSDVIIFSDKSCAYPNAGDPRLDWKRWYKRAVQDSIGQINGAERWLREHPERVFADNRCTVPLDVRIPSLDEMRVHRVVVALGARERCFEHFSGGSGSLPIRGGRFYSSESREPFCLGNEEAANGFVHVFDDVALEVVLGELDTAADFVEYLSKKEELFTNHPVIATGEEDLLAHYLLTLVGNEHVFIPPQEAPAPFGQVPGLFVDESAFRSLISWPPYSAAKAANKPSYVWDRLIEHFVRYYRSGQLEQGVAAEEFEQALRVMATPSRVVRRRLGSMLLAAVQMTRAGPGGPRQARYISVSDTNEGAGLAYGVVCLAKSEDISRETYRTRRQALMELYARSLRVRLNTIERVLVVGVNPQSDRWSSEDLALIELPEWTPELDARTREEMELFGLGAQAQRYHDQEFPSVERRQGGREAERRRKQMEKLRKKRDGSLTT